MSTCPENDIHSIYLDNELPQIYLAEYEKHLNSCQKCKEKLEKFKKINNIFFNDSKSLELDNIFLEQSFDRLQSRMRYSKVISKSKNVKKLDFSSLKNYIPAAVAAAVVFAIMLPFNIKSQDNAFKKGASLAQVKTIKRTSNFSIDQNQLLANSSQGIYPISLISSTNGISMSRNSFRLQNFEPISDFTNKQSQIKYVYINKLRNRPSKAEYSKLLQDDFFMPEFTQPYNSDNVLEVYMPTYVDISSLNK